MRSSAAPIAAWLAGHHGVAASTIRFVANLDCEIWRLRTAAAHPRELALRIYPPRVSDAVAIADEVTWLVALGEAGLHVPTPQRGLDGAYVHAWPDGRLAVLLTWVGGRLLDKGLRPVHLKRVGRLAGAMHRIAEGLVHEGRIAGDRPGDGPALDAWADGRRTPHPALPASEQRAIERAARSLRDELAALPRDEASWGFIHSDLHLWNLLFEGRAAGAIDFSECGRGHHALDLAAVLQYLKHPCVGNHDQRQNYPRLRDALFEGYAAERPLPPAIEQQVDTYVRVRMINVVEWVLDCWPSVDERPWGRALLQRAGSFFTDTAAP